MIRRMLVAVLVSCFAGVPLAAHHSWAGFDQMPTVFEGRVQSLTIANPHTLIDIKATDGRHYRVVFMAASALGRVFTGGAAEMAERIRVNDSLVISGRLKHGGEVIEVLALQIDDARGTPLYPRDRVSSTGR